MDLEWVWDNEPQDQWIQGFWSASYWVAFIDAIKGKDGMESSIFSEGVRASGCELGTWRFLSLRFRLSFNRKVGYA
jgi:hypothetical protein